MVVYALLMLCVYGLQLNSEQIPGSTPRQSESTATGYSEEAGSCDVLSKHRSACLLHVPGLAAQSCHVSDGEA